MKALLKIYKMLLKTSNSAVPRQQQTCICGQHSTTDDVLHYMSRFQNFGQHVYYPFPLPLLCFQYQYSYQTLGGNHKISFFRAHETYTSHCSSPPWVIFRKCPLVSVVDIIQIILSWSSSIQKLNGHACQKYMHSTLCGGFLPLPIRTDIG